MNQYPSVPESASSRDAFIQAAYLDGTFRDLVVVKDELASRISAIRELGTNPRELVDAQSAQVQMIELRRGYLHDVWDRSYGDESLFLLKVRVEDLQLEAEASTGTEDHADVLADLRHAKDDLNDYLGSNYGPSPDSTD